MPAPKSASAPKALSQKAYDAYRNRKGKPRRPVAAIGAAELAELGIASPEPAAQATTL